MPVNLNTKKKQQREIIAQARIRRGFELAAFRRFFAYLNQTNKKAADAVLQGAGMNALGIAMKGSEARTLALLSTTYRDVFPVFGARTIEAVAPSVAGSNTFLSQFEASMRQYIQDYGPLKSAEINVTTMSSINKSLLQSFDEGLSLQQTALKLTKGNVNISRVRATKIARTEVHSASQAASIASTDGLNIPLQKIWLAVNNTSGRTRATHLAANEQVRNKDGLFDIGGALMRYPSDPTGPAREVINCRCVIGWQTET